MKVKKYYYENLERWKKMLMMNQKEKIREMDEMERKEVEKKKIE